MSLYLSGLRACSSEGCFFLSHLTQIIDLAFVDGTKMDNNLDKN